MSNRPISEMSDEELVLQYDIWCTIHQLSHASITISASRSELDRICDDAERRGLFLKNPFFTHKGTQEL